MNASRRVTTLFARIADASVRASTGVEDRALVLRNLVGRDGLRRFFVVVLASIAILNFDIGFTTIARQHLTATSLSNIFVGVILVLVLVATIVMRNATGTGTGAPEYRVAARRRAAAPWLIAGSLASL